MTAPRSLSDSAQAKMIEVPAGLAVLGSTEAERAQARMDFGHGGDRQFANEANVRRAHVGGFRMDAVPVTNAAFAEFVASCGVIPPDTEALTAERWGAERREFGQRYDYGRIQHYLWTGNDPPEGRERHPAVLVSQDQAGYYCAWRGARLPTEMEYERAARGYNGNIYPYGERYDPFRANIRTKKIMDTGEVGSFADRTPEGFSDLAGNVYQWTRTAAVGKADAFVVKGNAFDGRGGYGRGAARQRRPAGMRDVNLGFRCASDL